MVLAAGGEGGEWLGGGENGKEELFGFSCCCCKTRKIGTTVSVLFVLVRRF